MTARSFLAAGVLVLVGLACTGDGNIVGPGPPASLSITPGAASVPVGETVRLSATLLDSEGNPLPTTGVTWTSSDSQIAQVSADGSVTGMGVGGPVTITAIVEAHIGRADITVTHGAPSELRLEAEPSSSAQSGVALTEQPLVQVFDAYGNEALEPGVLVTAVLAQGPGTLENATTTTDAQGRANFSGLAISGAAGTYRIRFEAPGLTAVESNVIALGAGPPATVNFVVEPSPVAQGGIAFSTQPQVVVLDGEGNPVGGTPVSVTLASGQGTLIGTTTVTTDGSGLATFTNLGVSGPAGDFTLRFSAGSATLDSSTITLVGVPATVTVLTQPSGTAQAGAQFAQQPVVEVTDIDGHLVPSYDVVVTVGSGGGTVGGTVTVSTDGSGVATFTDLSISGLVGTKTLRFTAGSAFATSNTIDLQAGPLATLTITQQPSSTVANGATFPQQPIVEATDASGNTLSGLSVTAEIASGGGTLGGTTSVNTVGGLASFSDLSITGTVGVRTLRFYNGVIDVTSNSITVDAGAPASATILTEPPEFTFSGVTLSRSPVVEVRDVSGNLVSGTQVVASIDSGGGGDRRHDVGQHRGRWDRDVQQPVDLGEPGREDVELHGERGRGHVGYGEPELLCGRLHDHVLRVAADGRAGASQRVRAAASGGGAHPRWWLDERGPDRGPAARRGSRRARVTRLRRRLARLPTGDGYLERVAGADPRREVCRPASAGSGG